MLNPQDIHLEDVEQGTLAEDFVENLLWAYYDAENKKKRAEPSHEMRVKILE